MKAQHPTGIAHVPVTAREGGDQGVGMGVRLGQARGLKYGK